MESHPFLVLGAALVFLAACESTTPGAQCEETASQVQAVMTWPTTAEGQVAGFLVGGMTFEVTQRQAHPDGSETLQTRHVFTTANGEIRTEDTTTLGPLEADDTRTVDASLTLHGGTATFANVSGSLTASGTVDHTTEPDPTLRGSYTGEICW